MADKMASPRLRKNVLSPKQDTELGPTPRKAQSATPQSQAGSLNQSVRSPVASTANSNGRLRKVLMSGGIAACVGAAVIGGAVYGSQKAKNNGQTSSSVINAAKFGEDLLQFPTCNIEGGLETVNEFNVFLFGDMYGRNSDVWGRVAAGGNVDVASYGIGDRLYPSGTPDACPNPGDKTVCNPNYTVIVNGALSITNSHVHFGGMSYGAGSNIDIDSGSWGDNCPSTLGKLIDFDAAYSDAKSVSCKIASMNKPLSKSGLDNGAYILKLDGNKEVEYFVVKASELAQASSIQLQGTPQVKNGVPATILINVVGGTHFSTGTQKDLLPSNVWEQYASYILWNFKGFTSVTFGSSSTGVNWWGSVLAVDADVNGAGQLTGDLIAKSFGKEVFNEATMQVHTAPYLGKVFRECPPVQTPAPTPTCVDCGLGLADDFNVFLFGNMFGRNSDIWGRVAAGGDLDVASYGIGDRLYPAGTLDACPNPGEKVVDYSNYTVIVDGKLSITSSHVFYGGLSYGDGSNIDIDSGSWGDNCPSTKGTLIDFSAAYNNLNGISKSLSKEATISGSELDSGAYYFYLDGDVDTEYFEVDASEFAAASSVWFIGSPKITKGVPAAIVINVVGGPTFSTGVRKDFLPSSVWESYADEIVWNFNGFTKLTLGSSNGGINWWGSVLAVDATVDGAGQFSGQLIADSFGTNKLTTVTMEVHNTPFNGRVCRPCVNGGK